MKKCNRMGITELKNIILGGISLIYQYGRIMHFLWVCKGIGVKVLT